MIALSTSIQADGKRFIEYSHDPGNITSILSVDAFAPPVISELTSFCFSDDLVYQVLEDARQLIASLQL